MPVDESLNRLWGAIVGGEEDSEVLEKLKEVGSDDISAAKEEGKGLNLLHLAAIKGYDSSVIDALKDAGVDINATDSSGLTPLHQASYNGNFKSVQALIAKGADIASSENVQRDTPLHAVAKAAAKGNESELGDLKAIANLLVKYGANKDVKNGGDKTADDILQDAGITDFFGPIYAIPLEEDGGLPPLMSAEEQDAGGDAGTTYEQAASGEAHGAQEIYNTLDPNRGQEVYNTLSNTLSLGQKGGKKPSSVVADEGIYNRLNHDPNAVSFGKSGGLRKVAEMINNNSDFNSISGLIERLEEYEINAYIADDDGNTLLHLAAKQGNEEVFNALLEKGADSTMLNDSEETAENLLSHATSTAPIPDTPAMKDTSAGQGDDDNAEYPGAALTEGAPVAQLAMHEKPKPDKSVPKNLRNAVGTGLVTQEQLESALNAMAEKEPSGKLSNAVTKRILTGIVNIEEKWDIKDRFVKRNCNTGIELRAAVNKLLKAKKYPIHVTLTKNPNKQIEHLQQTINAVKEHQEKNPGSNPDISVTHDKLNYAGFKAMEGLLKRLQNELSSEGSMVLTGGNEAELGREGREVKVDDSQPKRLETFAIPLVQDPGGAKPIVQAGIRKAEEQNADRARSKSMSNSSDNNPGGPRSRANSAP